MEFLTAVKNLFPSKNVRTTIHEGALLMRKSDILELFTRDVKVDFNKYDPKYEVYIRNDNIGNTFTLWEYFTELAVMHIVNLHYCDTAVKIREEISRIRSSLPWRNEFQMPVSGINIIPRSYEPPIVNTVIPTVQGIPLSVKLTTSVLREFIKNVFPDDVFIDNLKFGGSRTESETTSGSTCYHSSMYMPKYNISFELPGVGVDPGVRSKFVAKTNTRCIQIRDETTFEGHLDDALRNFSVAIGVATTLISIANTHLYDLAKSVQCLTEKL